FGAGLGLRINTPIGNLRLDYGHGSEGGRTHFSIGHAF
ncbi:MAG: BamA/TamA family outer membrane protein, partial [Abditibacteriota bacterium]|nr:BamA/TamA family outer membrane protein [Abditibacteriota bacterium]